MIDAVKQATLIRRAAVLEECARAIDRDGASGDACEVRH